MTPTQTRLVNAARFHPRMRGMWPQPPNELSHHAISPSVAATLFALRPGRGYCVAWINGPQQGCYYYQTEDAARAYFHRAVTDMEGQHTP